MCNFAVVALSQVAWNALNWRHKFRSSFHCLFFHPASLYGNWHLVERGRAANVSCSGWCYSAWLGTSKTVYLTQIWHCPLEYFLRHMRRDAFRHILVTKPYSQARLIHAVVKRFETRPATMSTKQSPGFCVTCSKVATIVALFQLEHVVIIQRYCDGCLPKANYEIGLSRCTSQA